MTGDVNIIKFLKHVTFKNFFLKLGHDEKTFATWWTQLCIPHCKYTYMWHEWRLWADGVLVPIALKVCSESQGTENIYTQLQNPRFLQSPNTQRWPEA